MQYSIYIYIYIYVIILYNIALNMLCNMPEGQRGQQGAARGEEPAAHGLGHKGRLWPQRSFIKQNSKFTLLEIETPES